MKILKILVINTVPFDRNGITSVIMNFYRELNHKVAFDFIANTTIAPEFELEIKQGNSKLFFFKNRKKNPIGYMSFLRKIIRDEEYELIHIHGNSSLMSIEILAISRKVKVLCHGHNVVSDYPFLNKLLNPYFKKNYENGIVPTEEAGKFLFNNNDYIILRNGIDTLKFKFNIEERARVRNALNIKDEKVIISVGNFNQQKYQKLLIEILPDLVKRDKYRLLLVGDGDKKNELIKLAENTNVIDFIEFLGSVSDVENYYSASDIFVLPTYWESFGMVIVEAQANGLPCIVSDTVPKIVKQGDNFSFVSNENVSLWIEDISKAHRINNEVDLSVFDIKEICKELYSIYKSII